MNFNLNSYFIFMNNFTKYFDFIVTYINFTTAATTIISTVIININFIVTTIKIKFIISFFEDLIGCKTTNHINL